MIKSNSSVQTQFTVSGTENYFIIKFKIDYNFRDKSQIYSTDSLHSIHQLAKAAVSAGNSKLDFFYEK